MEDWLLTQGKLDLALGRDNEITRLAECLGRKTKNSLCLIGEAGVGKTAVVEALAQRIEDGTAPATLLSKQVFTVNVGKLTAGYLYTDDIPERVAKFIAPFKDRKDIILVSPIS